MAQAALHNEMSTGLNILIFDRALSEPLDCYEIIGSHLHTPNLSYPLSTVLKVFRWYHRTSLSTYHNFEQHFLWPDFTILTPLIYTNLTLRWIALTHLPIPHTPYSPTVLWEAG